MGMIWHDIHGNWTEAIANPTLLESQSAVSKSYQLVNHLLNCLW